MSESNTNELDALLDIERRASEIIERLKAKLYDRLANVPFKGQLISDGRDGRPLIGIVKLSQLETSDNWSPDYHFPQMQANAVECRLKQCKNAKQLVDAVREMLNSGYVSVYKYKYVYAMSDRVYLSDTTLKIILYSEIGWRVMEIDRDANVGK